MPNPALDKLTEEVTENTSVTQSAIALITGLAEKVRAVAGDEAATLDLANQLDAQNAGLAAAVAANTPGEQPTP